MREIADDELFNKEISGYVYRTSREGTAFFSEDGYRGFIHHTERDVEPRLGEFIKGRIIAVKDDGTVNVSLKPLKQDRMADDADTILTYLESHDGVIPFGNKSDPEDIRTTFNMSKSAFKRALGRLLKENKIKPGDNKTILHKERQKKSDYFALLLISRTHDYRASTLFQIKFLTCLRFL